MRGPGWLLALVYLVSVNAFSYPLTPRPDQTPGHLCTVTDPDFKEFRYAERIPYCDRGVSGGTKNKIYKIYGIPANCKGRFTIDHLIPLAIGGSNDESNLWPEHKLVKALRPGLETKLYHDINSGRITQNEAIQVVLGAKFHPESHFGSLAAGCDTQDPAPPLDGLDVAQVLLSWLQ